MGKYLAYKNFLPNLEICNEALKRNFNGVYRSLRGCSSMYSGTEVKRLPVNIPVHTFQHEPFLDWKPILGIYANGYTTLRRTTLRLLSHFVEKAFCRSVISSNVHFVETGFRRILSTKYSMLTWPPYCIC